METISQSNEITPNRNAFNEKSENQKKINLSEQLVIREPSWLCKLNKHTASSMDILGGPGYPHHCAYSASHVRNPQQLCWPDGYEATQEEYGAEFQATSNFKQQGWQDKNKEPKFRILWMDS